MRFRIEVNGFYAEKGKGTVSGGEQASDIAPGGGPVFDWRAEKVKAVLHIAQIFQDANGKGKITLLFLTPMANRTFKIGREFSKLTIEVKSIETGQTHVTASGGDLEVIGNVVLPKEQIPAGSNPPCSAVTFSIGSKFSV